MNRSQLIVLAGAVATGGQLAAGETDFPRIADPGIPGTPRLGQPTLVMEDTKPTLTEQHGLAAQQYWDDTIGKLYEEGKAHWLTLRHQGRIYVMLGQKRGE